MLSRLSVATFWALFLQCLFTLISFSDQDLEDCGGTKTSSRRSRARRLPRNYMKLLSGCANVRKQMHESVAIANAAELFKLIFLSNSKAPEVPTLLAETLRRYSEHDLFAAFSYLREKKIMVNNVHVLIVIV